ncbi:MAG: hypothetical protein WB760_01385 [Xanthobacteraceae bacterium]
MIFFLTSHSLWLSGFIIIGLGTLLATLGPSVVRHFVALDKLTTNNEIAGFKFATVGVLYAVLLAFAIIVVWQKYSDAETTVAQEAGAAAAIFQLSYGIDEKPGIALRSALSNYLTHAIADDWPAMERVAPGGSPSARQALDAVYTPLLTFQSNSPVDAAVLAEILHQVDQLTQARRVRLVQAEGVVPGVVWLILFGGAVVTLGFTFFFGAESLRAQTLMTALLAILMLSELFIIVAIDRPFTGSVRVEPSALEEVLKDFGPEPSGSAPAIEPHQN